MTEPGLHGRPTVAELVAAVREFLLDDVMERTDGRVRFHARVAANALATVERELEKGAQQEAEHRRGLERLGFESEAELARAIRRGDVDDRYQEVLAVVEAAVTARLAVANPDY